MINLVGKIIFFVFIFFIFQFSAFTQNSTSDKRNILKLTAPSVIQYLLSSNYDVKKALLDYKKTASPLIRYRGKYDCNLYAGGSLTRIENNSGYNPNLAAESYSNISGSAGISKQFSTGTSVKAGLTASMPSYKSLSSTGEDLNLYQTGLSVELSQEILKNSFGVNDRLEERKIYNQRLTSRENIRSKLAGLIVEALVSYWNIAIAEENLKTRKISLKSTADIKKLVQRKILLGLSEREEVDDWSGKVLDEKSRRDIAEKSLFDAKLGMKRVLSLDPDVVLLLGKTFREDKPAVSFQEALKDAFMKRSDLKNKRIELKNAGIDYEIAVNSGLPSLKIKATYGNNSYDPDSHVNSTTEYNPEYSVGFEFSYPLNGKFSRADLRDSRIGLQSLLMDIKQMEVDIRDDIVSKVKQCDVDFRVYEQTKRSSIYARNYYNQVYRKFKKGRYSAVELKIALDSYILSRQAVLKSLVDYNISLLRRDLARNVVFEKFNIDIDSILKM